MAVDDSGPRMSVGILARLHSDPDVAGSLRLERAKRERAEVWSKVVQIRKQRWRIELWSRRAKNSDFKAYLLLARSESKVAAELNEKHSAFFVCADLLRPYIWHPTTAHWGCRQFAC